MGSVDEDGQTLLHKAAAGEDVFGISAWVIAGGSPDPRTNNQDTPLHFAVWNKKHEAVLALLAAGADPDAANYRGQTPFHHAVAQGNVPAIEALAEQGASWTKRDTSGATPLALWALPRSAALRRSRQIDPRLIEVLAAHCPLPEWDEPVAEDAPLTLREQMANTHGHVFVDQLKSVLENRHLERTLPRGRSVPPRRM